MALSFTVFQATRVNPTHYRLHQKRYLIDSDQGNKDEEEHNPLGYKWDIPLTWFSDKGSKKVEQKWLLSSDGYVDVKVDATATFVKFNVGQFGFYRVNYPKEEWIRFSKVLQEDHAQFSKQISFPCNGFHGHNHTNSNLFWQAQWTEPIFSTMHLPSLSPATWTTRCRSP